ncbi:MAG: response regulator, partial [Cyclobacteriaceae bacterium]
MGKRTESEVMELKVLFVEDSVDDYELIVNKMVKAGLIVVSKRVETPEDFEYELTNEEWNLIISDNSLPRFDSQKALKITRSLRPEIPFIIVSGTIGEEN